MSKILLLIIYLLSIGYGSSEVICDDGSACPPGNTCCIDYSGYYSCCAYPRATCCSDRVHCCPSDRRCDLSTRTCVGFMKSSFDLFQKINPSMAKQSKAKFDNEEKRKPREIVFDSFLRYFNKTELADTITQIRSTHKVLKRSIIRLIKDVKNTSNTTLVTSDLLTVKSSLNVFLDSLISGNLNQTIVNEFEDIVRAINLENLERAISTIDNHFTDVVARLKTFRNALKSHNFEEAGVRLGELIDYLLNPRERLQVSPDVFKRVRNLFSVKETPVDFVLSFLKNFGLNETAAMINSSGNDIVDVYNTFVNATESLIIEPNADIRVRGLLEFKTSSNKFLDDVISAVNNQAFFEELKSTEQFLRNYIQNFDLMRFAFNLFTNFDSISKSSTRIVEEVNKQEFIDAGITASNLIRLLFQQQRRKLSHNLLYLAEKNVIGDEDCDKLINEYIQKIEEFLKTKSIITHWTEFKNLILEYGEIKKKCQQ